MAEKAGGEEQRWAAEMATAMAQASGVQAAPLIRRNSLWALFPKK